MINLLKKYKVIILIVLATILVIFGLGYLFATKQSEPKFETKIDRIMFERKNRSPNFVITLPNQEQRRALLKKEEKTAQNPPAQTQQKGFSAINLVNEIPLMAKLKPITSRAPLKNIEIISEMSENVEQMTLPKIAKDGRKPWVEYSKSETVQPNFYKVAILLKNLGMDNLVTTAAIETMPDNVSLSFSPYAINPTHDIKTARSFGHETYMDLLLCSPNFLKADSGPMAMSITQDIEENLRRAKMSMNVNAPVGGMVINSGIADEDTREQIEEIIKNIQQRGLLIIDATNEDGIEQINIPNLPRRKADIVIESKYVRADINEQLKKAEEIAKINGAVLIVANPKPVVLHALIDWINTFSPQLTYEQIKEQNIEIKKPFALVPISNLVVE